MSKILERLASWGYRILDVEKIAGGLRFTEACDNYFSIDLTAQEVMEFCDELKALLALPTHNKGETE